MGFPAHDTHARKVVGKLVNRAAQGPFSMFGGYEEREDYEDELYQERGDSSGSEVDSELEFKLYSQVHYSSHWDEEEEEEEQEEGQPQQEVREQSSKGVIVIDSDPEIITVSDVTEEEEGVCVAKGNKLQHLPPASRGQPHAHVASQPVLLSEGSEDVVLDSDSDSDSDEVESWMVLGQEKQDCDETIQLNLEGGAVVSSGEDEDDDRCWTISRKDVEAQISNQRLGPRRSTNRYYTGKSITCRSCNKTGHLSKNCPNPKKLPSCTLCASQAHLQKTCPNRHCSNCSLPGHCYDDCLERAYWHKQCHRCGMTGHFFDVCPDIWRQYHLTTKKGPLIRPDGEDAPRSPAYCYNCSRKGHFGFECSWRRMFNGTYPTTPYISHYDTPQDVRQRENRMRRKAQELQNAGLLQPTDAPQGDDREEGPPRKRMYVQNKTLEKKRKDEAPTAKATNAKKKKQQQKQQKSLQQQRKNQGQQQEWQLKNPQQQEQKNQEQQQEWQLKNPQQQQQQEQKNQEQQKKKQQKKQEWQQKKKQQKQQKKQEWQQKKQQEWQQQQQKPQTKQEWQQQQQEKRERQERHQELLQQQQQMKQQRKQLQQERQQKKQEQKQKRKMAAEKRKEQRTAKEGQPPTSGKREARAPTSVQRGGGQPASLRGRLSTGPQKGALGGAHAPPEGQWLLQRPLVDTNRGASASPV
ncbi:hypothetical protein SKAU_G00393970 [Synaphobranchus kaupii]|uniref:Zinc finger CCHC domain-containing protein 7 n=1 Tax=Synaphobranchus kaupii TaxID=118154 RepID=A0A9Q1EC33_SYNKA|nr:hypothetical protein SKAU_G00393970 [Synaphobranchus kaupii]